MAMEFQWNDSLFSYREVSLHLSHDPKTFWLAAFKPRLSSKLSITKLSIFEVDGYTSTLFCRKLKITNSLNLSDTILNRFLYWDSVTFTPNLSATSASTFLF